MPTVQKDITLRVLEQLRTVYLISIVLGVYDRFVFNKTKEAFGGRVRYMITASAPISGEILEFLKIVTCCPVLEGYG